MVIATTEPEAPISQEIRDLVLTAGSNTGREPLREVPGAIQANRQTPDSEQQAGESAPETASETPQTVGDLPDDDVPVSGAPANNQYIPAGDEDAPSADYEHADDAVQLARAFELSDEDIQSMDPDQLDATIRAIGRATFDAPPPPQQPPAAPAQPPQYQQQPPPQQVPPQQVPPQYEQPQVPQQQQAPPPVDYGSKVKEQLERMKEESGYGNELDGLVEAMQEQAAAQNQNLVSQIEQLQSQQWVRDQVEAERMQQQQAAEAFRINQLIDGLNNIDRYGENRDGGWNQDQANNAIRLHGMISSIEQSKGITATPKMVAVADQILFGASANNAGTEAGSDVQGKKARALKKQSGRRMGTGSKAAASTAAKWEGDPRDDPALHARYNDYLRENGAI